MSTLSKPNKKQPRTRRFHFSSKDREYFIDNMSLLLRAAVPLGEALSSLQQTSKSKQSKQALEQIKNDIDEGTPLWKSLEKSGVVGGQTLALVRLGEQSGKLVENLRVAAKQEEKQRIFKAKVRSALMYPGFVLSLTLIVGLGVAWFLLPRLADTFDQINLTLPLISRILIGFGLFLKAHGIIAVPAFIIGLILLVYILFSAPKTKRFGYTLLFHTPGVSRLMYEVEVARFGYLLGTLLEAGLTVTQALELLERATTAPNYQKLYRFLRTSFEDGYSFRTSFPKYKGADKLIPASVQQMVIAGERSGSLSETLLSVGGIYEEKADISTKNLETTMEPVLLIFVWLGVMMVAVAVIMPIYSLVGGLKQ